MIHAGRLRDARHVVEHDRRRQPLEEVRDLDDLVAQHMDLDVPAEIVDALRQRLEHLDRRCARLDEVEADSANAEIIEPLELGVGDARIDDRDATCGRAELGHRIEGAGIIGSVG